MKKLLVLTLLLVVTNVFPLSLEEQSNLQEQKKDLVMQKGKLLKSKSVLFNCETNVGVLFYDNKVGIVGDVFKLSDEDYILLIDSMNIKNKPYYAFGFNSYTTQDKKVSWGDFETQYEFSLETNTFFIKMLKANESHDIIKLKCLRNNPTS